MSTNNGDCELPGVLLARDLSGKGGRADDIQSSDTKEFASIKSVVGFQNLGGNGDSGVDGVRDNKNVGLGAKLSNTSDQGSDDSGVLGEEFISGHAGLAYQLLISLVDLQ